MTAFFSDVRAHEAATETHYLLTVFTTIIMSRNQKCLILNYYLTYFILVLFKNNFTQALFNFFLNIYELKKYYFGSYSGCISLY